MLASNRISHVLIHDCVHMVVCSCCQPNLLDRHNVQSQHTKLLETFGSLHRLCDDYLHLKSG